jgi:hypothetical protein
MSQIACTLALGGMNTPQKLSDLASGLDEFFSDFRQLANESIERRGISLDVRSIRHE